MIGHRVVRRFGSRDDAEKPFWISFADLMTALMVLFLVALSVALNQAQDETIKAKRAQEELAKAKAALENILKTYDAKLQKRNAEVKAFLDEVDTIVRGKHEGVMLDRARHVINFGTRAQFASNSHELSLDQANVLRKLVPDLLSIIRDKNNLGKNWLKRIVAEGFTDDTGSYLLNLNLSLQRSQRVVCVLLASEWPETSRLGAPQRQQGLETILEADKKMIRQLFLVGGYSSNSQKPGRDERSGRDESRRIELRIEFFQLDETRPRPQFVRGDVGRCALGGR